MEKEELLTQNECEISVKEEPKKRTGLFVVSLIFSIIGIIFAVLAFFLLITVINTDIQFDNASEAVAAPFVVLIQVGIPFILSMIAIILEFINAIVAFSTGIPLLKKEKSPRGIVMTVISSLLMLSLPAWILIIVLSI